MTTIAQNDQNYLRILNFWVKNYLTDDNGSLVSVSILAETKIFFFGFCIGFGQKEKWLFRIVSVSAKMKKSPLDVP